MSVNPIIPWWLLAALCVVMAVGIVVLYIRRPAMMRTARWYVRIAILCLLCLLLWKPQFYIGTTQEKATLLDVYFVVDTTQSIVAEDYDGKQPRITGIKKDIDAIMQQLSGARFSVITFDNRATTALALTTDASAVKSVIASATPVIYTYAGGSSISEPVDLLKETLNKAQISRPERSRIVFYFSDGEHTSKQPITSFESIRPYIAGGAVLGYGTPEGGRMIESTYSLTDYGRTDTKQYIKTVTKSFESVDALSKYNEANLQKISNDINVPYLHRTAPDDGKNITQPLKPNEMVAINAENSFIQTQYDVSWAIALLICLLLIVDYRQMLRGLRKMPQGGATV